MPNTGIDILPWLLSAWVMLQRDGFTDDPDLTLHLILTGAIAESELNPYAERYGVWPDISFGLSQRIVKFHWAGNGTNTPDNIIRVRDQVFAHPEKDLYHMGKKLWDCLFRARLSDLRRIGGNVQLGALVCYNAGRVPAYMSDWWTIYAKNVNRYREAQLTTRQLLERPR